MARKTEFSREMVLSAAIEAVRRDGIDGLSAAGIAQTLGSSTRPIYSAVASLKEMESEIWQAGYQRLLDFQQRPYTGDPRVNMALGYLHFARDEKNLFRFLFIDRPRHLTARRQSSMRKDVLGKGHPVTGDDNVLAQRVWYFIHGLAVLIATGSIPVPRDDELRVLVNDAGEAFYLQMESRRNISGGAV